MDEDMSQVVLPPESNRLVTLRYYGLIAFVSVSVLLALLVFVVLIVR